MNNQYTIVRVKDVAPGDQCPVVARLDTYDEVMDHYDKVLMVEDPLGVVNGDYQIDGPETEE